MQTGTRLVLRSGLRAPPRAGVLPAAAAAASALVRCRLAAGSPAAAGGVRTVSDYAPRKETRGGSSHLSFWERWEKASAGEFHQGVGFDQDKKNDERFRMKLANQPRRRGAEFDEFEDIEDYDLPMPGPTAREAAELAAQLASHAAARDELASADIDPARR